MTLVQICVVALISILVIALAFAISRYRLRLRQPRWIEPEIHEQIDPILGRCEIQMPVADQNGCGVVRCWAHIDSRQCEFTASFFGSSESGMPIEESLEQLRKFYRLATDQQQLKLCKNSLFEAMPFHNAICPNVPLSDTELKDGAELCLVQVIDEGEASFTFSNAVFMGGRTITMHVGSDGSVSFVGVP
jgi:hypothetical protein